MRVYGEWGSTRRVNAERVQIQLRCNANTRTQRECKVLSEVLSEVLHKAQDNLSRNELQGFYWK
jgi:CRISPR/Cas system CSM-associated protein Csm2 small subunit